MSDEKDVTNSSNGVVWAADLQITGNLDNPGSGIYNVMHGDYGATGDGATDDATAIQAAIDAAEAAGGGIVYLPPNTYACSSNLTIDADNVELRGAGWGTVLAFTGAGIVIDATSTNIDNIRICDLQITRDASTGKAIYAQGGGAGVGSVTRMVLKGLNIKGGGGSAGSRLGTCIHLKGAQLTGIYDCYLRTAAYGIVSETASGNYGAFSTRVVNVDVLSVDTGFELTDAAGFMCVGGTIQTCATIGVDLLEECRAISFYGGWFENNATADIRAGNTATGVTALDVRGSFFNDSASAKDHAITLVRSLNTIIEANEFTGYAAEAVDVQEASAGAVTGRVTWNEEDGTGQCALNSATGILAPGLYTVTNESADRTYDANSTSTAELADVLGTLLNDMGLT